MPTKTKIRPIVRAAFKCEELVYQFTRIDVEDGLIKATGYDNIVGEVNAKYDDAYIIGEAENRLDIAEENLRAACDYLDLKVYRRDARQLRSFLKRFKKAAA
tara:strand:- start:351 stop:656 length:306 start_codon:yes stop_codon:yes gene_type:complete